MNNCTNDGFITYSAALIGFAWAIYLVLCALKESTDRQKIINASLVFEDAILHKKGTDIKVAQQELCEAVKWYRTPAYLRKRNRRALRTLRSMTEGDFNEALFVDGGTNK